MRPNIKELEAFIAVVKNGSFKQASVELNISKPQISRRISALESLLGTRLLNRSCNFVTLTPIGAEFAKRTDSVIKELDDVVEYVQSEMGVDKGHISIQSPSKFGDMYVSSAIAEFMDIHPEINVDVYLSDAAGPTVDEDIDFVLQIGRVHDSELKSRFFKPIRQTLVCSPDYYQKIGKKFDLDNLQNYECLVFKDDVGLEPWIFVDGEKKCPKVPEGRLVSNSREFTLTAAIDGRGLALVPQFMAVEAIEKDLLLEVYDPELISNLHLYAIFPVKYLMPTRVRNLIDFLVSKWNHPMPQPTTSSTFSASTASGRMSSLSCDMENPATSL